MLNKLQKLQIYSSIKENMNVMRREMEDIKEPMYFPVIKEILPAMKIYYTKNYNTFFLN